MTFGIHPPRFREPDGEKTRWFESIFKWFDDSTKTIKVSSAYTVAADVAWVRCDASGGAFAVTLPTSITSWRRRIGIIKTDSSANAVTITRAGSDTINGASTKVLNTQYASAELVADGISAWDVEADSGLRADLANSSNTSLGDALVGIDNSDVTDGVATTLHVWVKRSEKDVVKTFGAPDDGSSDSLAAYTNALEWVTSTGGKLTAPPDMNFVMSAVLPVPANTGKSVIIDLQGSTLDYSGYTGKGISFAGQSDGFVLANCTLSGPDSTNAGIFGNQAINVPLRDHVYENVILDRFRLGFDIGGGQNWRITGGKWTGQGKGVSGGYGIHLGANNACNLIRINGVYAALYQTGIYNVNGAPIYWDGGVLGTCEFAIRNASGKVYARVYLEDDTNSPDMTVVFGEGGYTWVEPHTTSNVTIASLVSDANHRTFVTGTETVRCVARRNAALSINGGPTSIALDTAVENDGSWFKAARTATAPTSITSSGTTATVTFTSHGYQVGNRVVIAGAAEGNYNGTFIVGTVPNADSFTYTMGGTATSPATGSPTVASDAQVLIPFAGFCTIDTNVDFTAAAAGDTILVGIYKNNALITDGSRGAHAGAAGQFGVSFPYRDWFAAHDVIDIRTTNSANLALVNARLSVFSG